MKERQQNTSQRNTITLDHYRGVGSDFIAVNPPVADGFMRVADMRNNIVIVGEDGSRVSDYDQLGSVKIGKQLKVLFQGSSDTVSRVRNSSDAWIISIDDQKISREAVEKNSGKLEDAFGARFKDEINSRIQEILLREKIIAQGHSKLITAYNLSVAFGLHTGLAIDLSGGNPLSFQHSVVEELAFITALSLYYNLKTNLIQRVAFKNAKPYEDHPYIRGSYKELFLPVVPVDRLIRGSLYLKQHKDQILTTSA